MVALEALARPGPALHRLGSGPRHGAKSGGATEEASGAAMHRMCPEAVVAATQSADLPLEMAAGAALLIAGQPPVVAATRSEEPALIEQGARMPAVSGEATEVTPRGGRAALAMGRETLLSKFQGISTSTPSTVPPTSVFQVAGCSPASLRTAWSITRAVLTAAHSSEAYGKTIRLRTERGLLSPTPRAAFLILVTTSPLMFPSTSTTMGFSLMVATVWDT